MQDRFRRQDIIKSARCPFCQSLIDRPKDLKTRMPTEMPLGVCDCGAVYACDVTGHNLGSAMIEALVFSCNGDWDLAWDLIPEEDYISGEVKNYDIVSHRIIPAGIYEGRRIAGTLYFIKLNEEIREVTEEGVRKRIQSSVSAIKTTPSPQPLPLTKAQVEGCVKDYNFSPLLSSGLKNKKILRFLQRLIYSADNLLRWRAMDAIGRVTAVIALDDPGAVSNLLQRLFISITDSASSSWGAISTIGEIIRNSPKNFAPYIPELFQFTRDPRLLPEIMRTFARISRNIPEPFRKKAFYFIPLLRHEDSRIRGYTVILLGNLKAKEAEDDIKSLLEDRETVEIYEKGNITRRTIGELASMALKSL